VKLTEKQKRFADYYIETGNAEESAKKAGYSEATARGHSHKLLQNVAILKYIESKVGKKDEEQIAKQDEILSYLSSIMRGEQSEQVLQGVGKGAQVITDMEVNAKDRIKAAELLGKRYGLWVDRQDIDVKGAVTFVDDIGDEDEA
jgi:phage terminase small subunit